MSDYIDRQAAIDAVNDVFVNHLPTLLPRYEDMPLKCASAIMRLPSAQPTLYGYKIEHLALIARVMQKENVTPEKAIECFEDIGRIAQMIVDELIVDLSPLEDIKLPAVEKSLEWHLQHKAFGFLDPIAEAFEALTDEDPEEAD